MLAKATLAASYIVALKYMYYGIYLFHLDKNSCGRGTIAHQGQI